MKEIILSERQLQELEDIYRQLQVQYRKVAEELDFSCSGCPDNCCDSYFQHHTYTEWAHLFMGFMQLEPARQELILEKARQHLQQSERQLAAGQRPQVMCPLNDEGLCTLYGHRLLVCRTHGVPAKMTRPDGQRLQFPGCFRCQEIVEARHDGQPPCRVERTPLLRRLALLENELLENRRHLVPRVKMTIAEMLVKGPPAIPRPQCEQVNGCKEGK